MKNGPAILVVEDEALIALEIEAELRREGADVVGPCYTLRDCLSTIDEQRVDGAILDVDVNGEQVFPAAERLRARGVPFVFHTGHGDQGRITRRFPDAQVFPKPISARAVVESLRARLATDFG